MPIWHDCNLEIKRISRWYNFTPPSPISYIECFDMIPFLFVLYYFQKFKIIKLFNCQASIWSFLIKLFSTIINISLTLIKYTSQVNFLNSVKSQYHDINWLEGAHLIASFESHSEIELYATSITIILWMKIISSFRPTCNFHWSGL